MHLKMFAHCTVCVAAASFRLMNFRYHYFSPDDGRHGCDFREINHIKTPDPSRRCGWGRRSNGRFFSLFDLTTFAVNTVIPNEFI